MTKVYDLIGGPNHGATVGISETQDRFDSPVFPGEDEKRESVYSERYTRRHFEGDEFGDRYECFGMGTDDETDTRELARMVLNHRNAQQGAASQARSQPSKGCTCWKTVAGVML